MARRSGRLVSLAFAAVAGTTCAAVATGAGLASVEDTPGLAPVPPGNVRYLHAPALGAGGKQSVVERPGPTTLSCHRWPDGRWTQTFDPSSPACVAGWDAGAGNGGSTARGVHENVITVGVARSAPEIEALVAFVNANYQLYGRSLKLVEIGGFGTVANQNAAVASAAEHGVFAATDIDASGAVPTDPGLFLTELAKRKIVGVTSGTGLRTDAPLLANGPYAWSWHASIAGRQQELADLACRGLKTGVARQAGRPTDRPRRFVVLTPSGVDAPELRQDTSAIEAGLRACGITAPVREYQDSGFAENPARTAADIALYRQLAAQGVSTVLFVGSSLDLMTAQTLRAEQAGVRLEWVGHDIDPASNWNDVPRAQAVNIVGLFGSLDLDIGTADPATAAALAGGADPSPDAQWRLRSPVLAYRSLSLVAAGIQAAGPHLTPESFAAGLESLDFPGPAARAPQFAPRVGFQFGDHVFRRDVLVGRPDFTQKGYGMPFTWCFAGRGERYGHTRPFPTSDAFLYDSHQAC